MQEWEAFEAVLHTRTPDDVRAQTSRFLRSIGMSNFGYASQSSQAQMDHRPDIVMLHDYDGPIAEHYRVLSDPTKSKEDPRVQHSRSNLPALPWNVRGEFGYAPPPDAERIFSRGRRLIMNAGEGGTTAGITIPCWSAGTQWGFATFSTNDTFDLGEIKRLTSTLHYLAYCIHGLFDRMSRQRREVRLLSTNEKDILSWCAIGKTSWEISMLTGISERNVNYHLGVAAHKLGTKGRRATVARAITLGLIAP